MKTLYSVFAKVFSQTRVNHSEKSSRNIFDYSTKERMELLLAAGREAQYEQSLLLQKYEEKFG